jgi:hypothetical protein
LKAEDEFEFEDDYDKLGDEDTTPNRSQALAQGKTSHLA